MTRNLRSLPQRSICSMLRKKMPHSSVLTNISSELVCSARSISSALPSPLLPKLIYLVPKISTSRNDEPESRSCSNITCNITFQWVLLYYIEVNCLCLCMQVCAYACVCLTILPFIFSTIPKSNFLFVERGK